LSVMAKRYIIGNLTIISHRGHCFLKLLTSLFILMLFVKNATFVYGDITVLLWSLTK